MNPAARAPRNATRASPRPPCAWAARPTKRPAALGAVDEADEQVETLFAAAVPDRRQPGPPGRLGRQGPARPVRAAPAARVGARATPAMDRSLEVVRRRREARARSSTHEGKVSAETVAELAQAGYWGMLIDPKYGGQGAPFARFARFLTRMATLDAMVAGLASVHGCIGAVDPRAHLRHAGAEAALPAAAGQRRGAVRLRPDRAGRRLRPDRPAHDRRRRSATTSRSPARSCSSPTAMPGRTIGLVVMLEGKPAVLIAELPPQENEQFQIVPLRPVRAAARRTTTACGSTTSACRGRTCSMPPQGDGLTIAYHGLNLGRRRAVRRRGRHACGSCWRTCCRGPSSAAPTASRSPRASWSSGASPAWPA